MDRVARRGSLKSHNAEKLKGGTLSGFSTSIQSQYIKKCRGDPLGKIFFRKKSLAVPKKNERGGGEPRMVCYAEKQKRSFWFSSPIVQFGAIIFCRTFVELFWSVRVDRKKKSDYNNRVSLHEAPIKKQVVLNCDTSL